MKVLVVDGCKTERRRLVEALTDLTNVVVLGAVPDLEAARKVLDNAVPDVVVTDAWVDELGNLSRPPAVIVYAREAPAKPGEYFYVPRAAGVREVQAALGEVKRPRQTGGDPFRLLGRLTAGVAHDLGNYLGAAELALDLVTRQGPPGAALVQARAAVDSAARLVRTLLDYARGAAPIASPVDVDALVRRTLALLARVIAREIVVIIESAPHVPRARGVESELEQVVLNLVLNACDAMPLGGELRVAVRYIDDEIELEISDTGAGLAELAAGTEDPLAPSTKPGRHAGGLGLGIVRSVLDRHRGGLRVRTRARGGTSVIVTLPAWNG